MSYNRRNDSFSVTAGRDGSRAIYSQHDDRWNNNNSNKGFRGRDNSRWNSRSRGGRRPTGFRNYNSSSSRFRTRRDQDNDGDIAMSGDSHSRGSSRGGRFSNYRSRGSRGYNNRRGGGGSGRSSEPLRGDNSKWFKAMIPFGAGMGKETLFKIIGEQIEGKFEPIQYHTSERSKRAFFFVQGGNEAEALRSCSRRITKPDGHKLVIHVEMSGPPDGTVGAESIEKLKVRMSDRYDPSLQLLNLSSLHTDDVLEKDNIFLPLHRAASMAAVIKIVKEYIPELTGLDVSCNKMLSLGHMTEMVKAAPGVTSLNLAKNQIRSCDELEKLKGWSNITELMLEGNDLCKNYSNQNNYVSAVRRVFPKVITLDGAVLPPPITFDLEKDLTLPGSQDCYFVNDEIKAPLVKFIKEYFSVYDSDTRHGLMDAYHENAQLTVCTSKNPLIDRQVGFHCYLDESRNLKRIGHLDPEKLVKKTKIGKLGIVALLESLPKTTHDLLSFKMDVTLALPTMLAFVLHGFFKESEARADKPYIRAFSRSFVTIPCGAGMVITNDMLSLSNATMEQSRRVFKDTVQTPSSSPASTSQVLAPSPVLVASPATATPAYTPEQQKMIQSFSMESRMNLEFSVKCLEENDWDYQKAAHIFTTLQAQGKIPPEAFTKPS